MVFVSDMLFQEKIGLSKMLFVIDEVKYCEDIIFVAGKTSAGTVKGIWKYSEEPVAGEYYHIELEINYPLEAGVSYKEKAVPSVYADNDTVIFKGICEDMDDEVYYLRFGADWLEMIDIGVFASKKQIGEYISFSASVYDITMYPYTL